VRTDAAQGGGGNVGGGGGSDDTGTGRATMAGTVDGGGGRATFAVDGAAVDIAIDVTADPDSVRAGSSVSPSV